MRSAVRKMVVLMVTYVDLGLLVYFLSGQFHVQELYKNALLALIGFAAVFHIFSALSGELIRSYGSVQQAKSAANALRFIGLLIALLVSLYFVKIDVSLLLLGGSIGGIVLGFAAQKAMENVFAGLLVLISRSVEIGDRIRIVSSALPQTTLTSPSYKFYSYDYLIQGYAGVVEEIGLFFTKVTLDSGLLMLLPNSIFLSSGVVNITKTKAGKQKMLTKIRYELPSSLDIDVSLHEIRKKLSDKVELRDVLVSEKNQERDTIIIAIEAFFENRREDDVKSEILIELLKMEKDLYQRQLTQNR